MRDLTRLLRPRSIAVLGGSWARAVIRQSRGMGFAGPIWPVHPEHAEVEGLPAVPSLADLPQAPDAVFIGVNRHATIDTLRELAAMGAGGAVSFASGFSETGAEGAALQADFVAAAGPMPVLGPNCYGFINALDGALLWPDLHGCARIGRGVAIVAQSSNIAMNLTMARRALPIAYVICLGNQAQTGLAEAVATLAGDPRVSVICLHIEGIGDADRFAGAVAAARAAGKPVLALKVGQSAESQALTMSHTASLAGSAAVGSAFLARLGVAEVETIPEFLEAAKLLHVLGPLRQGGLVSLSCSGGEASVVADAAARAGVGMPALRDADVARIRPTVNPLVTVSNPFDYHTFDWGNPDRLRPTFEAVMQGPQAVTALVLDWPKPELGPVPGWDDALDAFTGAAAAAGVKAAVVSSMPENMPDDRAARLAARGVAPMLGIAEMMAALRAAEVAGRPPAALPGWFGKGPALPALVPEAEGKARLAAHGLAVPEGRLVASAAEAEAAARDLAPVAMKAVGRAMAHKTEAGAVLLNLGPAGAGAAYARLAPLADAVLVERMVTGAVAELILGLARDPAFGLHMIVGAGGVLAELLKDRAILFLPFTAGEARAALDSLRIAPLLHGWRGKPAADIDAAVAAMLALQGFALAHGDRLAELDVNPLILTPTAAIAADVLLRWEAPHE